MNWSPGKKILLVVALASLSTSQALAQPAAPPPPDRFNAQIRYRINAPRDQHVAIYDSMISHLERAGFAFAPPRDKLPRTDREDPGKDRITGTIAPAKVLRLFEHRHIESVLLTPPGYKPPASLDTPVRVRLELASGFGPERQRSLARQTLALLHELGFREAVGYDHRGYTRQPDSRLIGTIPARNLDALLKDLRTQPAGWLGPRVQPGDLPAPLNQVVPILVTEVLGDAPAPKEQSFADSRSEPFLEKIDDALWALVNDKERQDDVVRLEVILSVAPSERDPAWREALRTAAPSLFIEGRLGAYVTCLARASQAPSLAALPIVSTVRLPRPARVAVSPAITWAADNVRALSESGLAGLHARGLRGKEVRVALIDADFSGYEELVKSGRLPATTRLLDLTAERNPDLLPEPESNTADLGHGTRCAVALALAAPDVDLTLIRVDPAAPYLLPMLAQCMDGGPVQSEYLDLRRDQLATAATLLNQRRVELMAERRVVLDSFVDESDFERQYGLLGPVGAWLYSARRWHQLRMDEWERDQQEHRARELRYLQYLIDLQNLKKIDLVSCSLAWNEGYPLGGFSPLSRWFDDTGPHRFLWFQSAGNTGGQTWNGPFRDADDNGVLEFSAPGAKLGSERWTNELNFLGWRPYVGNQSLDVPEGARVRITLQWREPHDPELFFRPDQVDLYRNPLATLRLLVLRQPDPNGKTLPADHLEAVARSHGLPQRLDNQPGSATYEIAVEFTATKAGRYALRVERQTSSLWSLFVDPKTGRDWLGQVQGLTPTGIKPLGTATLPALEKTWELWPRLYVEAVDPVHALQGRPVFFDFATDLGNIGMPGDARSLFSVSAAGWEGRPEPYAAKGPPPWLQLAPAPLVLAFDRLDLGPGQGGVALGSSLATPFATGIAATLRGSGMPMQQILSYVHSRCGQVFRVPQRP